jgi:hypothetical protein
VGEAGDKAEAARLFTDLVADQTRVLGSQHPYTVASLRSLLHYRRSES